MTESFFFICDIHYLYSLLIFRLKPQGIYFAIHFHSSRNSGGGVDAAAQLWLSEAPLVALVPLSPLPLSFISWGSVCHLPLAANDQLKQGDLGPSQDWERLCNQSHQSLPLIIVN